LVRWCDRFAADHPGVEVRIQYGSATAPTHAAGQSLWTKNELHDVLGRAHAVVSHGGPGTISEIRAGGTWPLVVPRDPGLGEHVDGHQLRFVERMDAVGLVERAHDESGLHAALNRRLTLPRADGLGPPADQRVAETVSRFADVVTALVAERRGVGRHLRGGRGR
jgi:UDP-N-acetylglucosamine transferase subunit ALG13